MAGWMAGSAASCKYTSVVFVVIPLSILVAVMSRRDWFRAVGTCALAVTLACGPWFAKSWVQTGNPVYPLLAGVFESQPRTPEQVAQFQRAHQVPVDVQGHRYSVSQAWDSLRLLLGGSLWHSPLIVPFTVLILLRRRTLEHAAFWIIGLLVIVTAWWLFDASCRSLSGPGVATARRSRRHGGDLVLVPGVARHDVDGTCLGAGRQLRLGRFTAGRRQSLSRAT